jgi:hypothetical protein
VAYAFVAVTKVQASTGASASGTVTTTAANAMLCCAASYCGTTTGSALAASGGGTWTTDTSVTDTNDANNKFKGLIASCPSATGGAQTVTISNGNASGATAFVYEFSGNVTSSIRDAASPAVAVGTSTAPLTNSLSNTTADAVFVAMFTNADGGNPATNTGGGTGWTYPAGGKETNGATFQILGSGYKIVSSVAGETSSWTAGNFRWDALIAVYKAAGGAAAADPPPGFPGADPVGLLFHLLEIA